MRKEYLRLPELDGRIPVLARRFTGRQTCGPAWQARAAIESHLQKDFGLHSRIAIG